MTNHNKIEEFLRNSMPSLMKLLIYHNEHGHYIMFEKYAIKKISSTEIIVERYRDEKEFKFSKLRNAVAWTVLDKNNKIYEANRLVELDARLIGLELDFAMHFKMKRNANSDKHIIILNKLQHDFDLQNKFQREIDKYIIMANERQERGFKNEPTRPS